MLQKKYIYHHLGLGDHIICNGLVRALLDSSVVYELFVKPQNLNSVSFMYRDLKNLKCIIGCDDGHVCEQLKSIRDQDKIIIGFGNKCGVSWDEYFYHQHNVDFATRWSNFFVNRDENKEKTLFKFLNPTNEKFILIHSKGSDNIDRLNYDFIDNKYKKIFVEKHTDNIFDYLLLIEKAEEIHCVESFLNVLVDSLSIKASLFFHTLKNKRFFGHKLKNKWKIV